jgi:hypothetical protein
MKEQVINWLFVAVFLKGGDSYDLDKGFYSFKDFGMGFET